MPAWVKPCGGDRRSLERVVRFNPCRPIPARKGFRFAPANRYTITATYNNTTGRAVDAMAGPFVFFRRNELRGPFARPGSIPPPRMPLLREVPDDHLSPPVPGPPPPKTR